ncbi:NHL repeat-containing protein 2 [Hordeum vulgare]|nr:NHL repeat-containing protein 2 [Hordeum vulgare]
MTACGEALCESVSMEMKHEVTALAAAWQSRRVRWIELCFPANSPEVSDDEDDTTMETSFDDTMWCPRLCTSVSPWSSARALQHRHGKGATCAEAYVGIQAGAGASSVDGGPDR